ncbi:ABC transporter substrate-binding protein [Bradyrhizobium sp. RDT10]
MSLALFSGSAIAFAQKKYDPGASDTEIKIGNVAPYSGPASSLGLVGKIEAAYFKMINDAGGIHGRKINFISNDDAYSPAKSVEQTRKLVESDEVLLVFGSIGTATNLAVQKYLNARKVPQLFVASGATRWNDPKQFPWTLPWQPLYQTDGHVFAKYILKEKPDARIAILYQNDDFGRDYLKGLRDGLGADVSKIVAEESYETSAPTIDSQIIKLKTTGADVLVNISIPRFAAQGIRKLAEIGWKPLHLVTVISASIGQTMKPAGLENAQGVISAFFVKDATDVRWNDDGGMKNYFQFMKEYAPSVDRTDYYSLYGYSAAQALVQVLLQCGDNLTRENVMKQAANLRDFRSEVMLPGITVNTSPTDYATIKHLQLMRLKGEQWEALGGLLRGDE